MFDILNSLLLWNVCMYFPWGGGGGILLIMAYTGRLLSKGVSFSGFRYMKE